MLILKGEGRLILWLNLCCHISNNKRDMLILKGEGS